MTKKDKIFLLLIFLLLFFLNIYYGKDINWDQRNYHLYGVHLWLNDRWGQDYFGGGFQGYLNPISYLPFYLMVQSEWNPLLISSLLLIVHFLNIFFILLIINLISSKENYWVKNSIILLSLFTPIFLTVAGTSFNDATCSALTLGAIYFHLKNSENNWLVVGVLCGVALAFKLTQAVYILCFIFLIFYFEKKKLYSLVQFTLSSLIAFLIFYGFWGWRLYKEFGSPFFPFFNGLFKAEDFFKENFHDSRFMGDYFWGILTLPFEMMLSNSWVYIESSSPELKIAVCFVLMVFYFAFRGKLSSDFSDTELKVLNFFFVGFVLWTLLSRIGRYALPIFMIAPVVIYIYSKRFFSLAILRIFMLLLIALQTAMIIFSDFRRWSPYEWGEKWISIDIPEDLQKKKALFISANNLSNSFLSLFLNKDSGLVNIVGQYNIPYTPDIPSKLEKIFNEFETKYLVFFGDYSNETSFVANKNHALKNYGIFVTEKCIKGYFKETYERRFLLRDAGSTINFCEVVTIAEESRVNYLKDTRKYDFAFEYIEDICNKFRPKRPASISNGKVWNREYIGTLSSLYIENDWVYAHGPRILHPVPLTSLNDLKEKNPASLCPDIYRKRYLY